MIFGNLVELFDIGDNDLITFESEKGEERVSVTKKKAIDLYGAKVSKIKPYSDTVYRKPIVFVVPDIWVKCFKDAQYLTELKVGTPDGNETEVSGLKEMPSANSRWL